MTQRNRTMGYLPDYENIGGHIDRALKKRNRTQVWLAEQLDIDKTHVNKWVNNHIRPSAKYLNQISEALDYEISEIITGQFKDERVYTPALAGQNGSSDGEHSEEIQLIESYVDRIINSKSEAKSLIIKEKLLNILRSIL